MYLGKSASTFLGMIKIYERNSAIYHHNAPHDVVMTYLTKGPDSVKAGRNVLHLGNRANCYWKRSYIP